MLLSGDKNPTGTESNTTNCPRYTFSTDIPDHYNETYICALPKNPEWMFVYWELGPEYQGSIAEQEKCGSKYVLRTEEFGVKVLNEIFSDAEKPLIVDTEIDARSNECYVRIPYSGKEYTITMGEIKADNEFEPIISTEPFSTAQKSIQNSVDSDWVLFSTDELIDYSADTGSMKETLFSGSGLLSNESGSDKNRYFGSASPD
ncbi:MAG: DUF4912 domain-containing protein [Fibrobacter sp.]|nr:DUF4912 domain-containing protein [Fibrobacter sp.]